MTNQDEIKYQEAVKKVAKIKAFYTHLIVYILINAFIIVKKTQNIDEGETIWHAFKVAFFWGIGLLFHALRVFDRVPFFGSDWEEKKVKELIEKEKKTQSNYEHARRN